MDITVPVKFASIEEAKKQIETINQEIFFLRKYKMDIRMAIKNQRKKRTKPIQGPKKTIKNSLIHSLRKELIALNETITDPIIEPYCQDKEPQKDFSLKEMTNTEYHKRWYQHRNEVASYLRSELERIKEANIIHKIVWNLS